MQMDSIKAAILNYRVTSPNDEKFIENINDLIKREGDEVCQSVIKAFVGLDIHSNEAKDIWFDIIDHRQAMYKFLGREVDILTVLCDYLSRSSTYFNNPMIIEYETYEKALEDSRHDTLTGLLNRGCFWEILEGNIAHAARHNTELTILFVDVDDFKFFNDSFGHQAGDKALKTIADVIKQGSRSDDSAIRYGGEEFVVIMPNTSVSDAVVLAERIRQKVADLIIDVDGKPLSLTISGGISSYPLDAQDGYMLLNLADRALYRAKALGKNNISIYAYEKQRRFLRTNLVRPIKIKKIAFEPTTPHIGASKNIGMGGMLFETPHQFDVGSHIEVSIPIMNSHPLFLIGSVVRVEKGKKGKYTTGMAMSFKDLEKVAKEEISSFLLMRKTGVKRGLIGRQRPNINNILEM